MLLPEDLQRECWNGMEKALPNLNLQWQIRRMNDSSLNPNFIHVSQMTLSILDAMNVLKLCY